MSDFVKGNITSFPYQKRSRAAKTKPFYKDCVEAADVIVGSDTNNSIRAAMTEKISNYNIINNIVDPEEVTRAVNPYNLEADFNANYKNYPLINSYLAVLLGEERKRRFNPIVSMSSPDMVNNKLEQMTAALNDNIMRRVISPEFNEEQAQQEIQKQSKWMKFNYRDRRERMAAQIINYGFHHQGMKEIFSRNFEDILIGGEEIGAAEIMAGEPTFRKINPLNLYTIRSGESPYIEDADMIIEISYVPIGQVIDDHHDELTSADIKKLEEGHTYNRSISNSMFSRQLINQPINLTSWVNQQGGIGSIISATKLQAAYLGGSFDEYGNVRKLRVLWKGMKKVGVLPFIDEEGDFQKRYVDEDYPLSDEEKESVKWVWISEWNEGIKLGDDTFVKLGPRPIQFRSLDNPSKCKPGIVGTAINVNSSISMSMVGMAKDYQLTYNYFMHKLWEELKTYKGKIAKISTSMIPSEFTMDQFLYYLDQMKIIFEDPFKEGNKGAAMGKLAGAMNQSSGSTEIGDAKVIENLLGILTFLEHRIEDITGITPQRKGAVENRETVGGVERAVAQSSLNTEKYYAIHDNYRIRALEVYLETAKLAWKGQKFKKQFVLGDGSQAILDFDSSIFNESEYGVYITNAAEDHEMMKTLRSLVQPFVQNGGNMSMVMELYRTQDSASLQRKFEAFEEQIQQQAQQAEEGRKQLEEAKITAELKQAAAELEMEKYKADLDSNTKIEVALIGAENKEGEVDTSSEDADKNREMKIKEGSLTETIRKNKRAEQLKEKEISIKKQIANKPVAKVGSK
jgi:hypothetical protein